MSLRSFIHVVGLLVAILAVVGGATVASPSPASATGFYPPVAVDDVAYRFATQCVEVDVLANDYDDDFDPISVYAVYPGAYAYVSTYTASTVTVCAGPGLVGTDYVPYEITDGTQFDTGVIEISNQAPVASPDVAYRGGNQCVDVDVLSNDSDPDGDPLAVTSAYSGSFAYVSAYTATTVTACAGAGQVGDDYLTYEMSDGYTTASGTITISNAAPVAVDDTDTVAHNGCVTTGVLSNDSDPDGDPISVSSVSAGPNGFVSAYGTHSITYCMFNGFVTTETYTYEISDGYTTDTGTVTLTVVNLPPVAYDDTAVTNVSYPVDISPLANDDPQDGDTLTVLGAGMPANGEVSVNGGTTITYTPDADFFGTDSFTYDVSDGVSVDTATVTVRVNRIPVAGVESATTHANTPVTIDVLSNDYDLDGDPLHAEGGSIVSNGTAVLNADNTFTFTPALNFVGTAELYYLPCDDVSCGFGSIVLISVTNANPVAVNDSASIAPNTEGLISVLDNDTDADGDDLALVSVTTPTHGTTGIAGGSVLYTPTAGYVGPDSFTYTMTDGIASTCGTCTATVNITVAYRPPVVTAPGNQTAFEGTAKAFNLGSFTDPDAGSSWSVAVNWGDGSATETFSVTSQGSLGTRLHTYGADATRTVTVTVTDGDGAVSTPRTFTVTVANVAPNLRAPSAQTAVVGVSKSFYLGYLTDPGTDDTTWSLAVNWGDGSSQTLSGPGIVSGASHLYYANHTYATGGVKTVTTRAIDPDGGLSAIKTFTINVNAIPVVTPPGNQTAFEGTAKAFNLGSLADANGNSPWQVSVTWGDGTAAESFSVNAVGSLGTRTHTYGADATRTVTVTVTDAAGGVSTPKTFTVTVANVAPNLRAGSAQTANTGAAKSFYLGYLTDPGADDTTWSLAVNWGDGSSQTVTGAGTLIGTSHAYYATHTYATGGAKTVTVQATDPDGGTSVVQSFVVTVNATPTVSAPGNQAASEGTAKAFTLGGFADANGNGPWQVRVNWGDGTAVETFSVSAVGSLGSRTHTFGVDATRTVTLTVTDAAGAASVPKTFTVTVANVAPNLRAGTAQTSNEGAAKSFYLGYFTDPGTDDTTWSINVSWDDGGSDTFIGAGTLVGSSHALYLTHTYRASGSYTARVKVTDEDGGESVTQSFVVTVANVAPNLRPASNQTAEAGVFKTFFVGYLTDPGTDDDYWFITIDWGDGTPDSVVSGQGVVVGTSHAYYAPHTYATAGAKTVTVTATDEDGGSSTRTFTITVT